MNTTTANDTSRCQHRTPSGRQCRFRTSGGASPFCTRHSAFKKLRHSADLAAVLAAGDEKTFQSAEGINHSLAELFTLLAKDRVSPRRAAVLAYIGSLLLRTVSAMEKDAAQDPKKTSPRIIWDIPAPIHEHRDPTP